MDQTQLEPEHRQSGLALMVPPGALVLVVGALMWVASAATPSLDISIPAKSILSFSLSLAGAIACVSGVISFRRAKTTVNPMKPASTSSLVVSGIYQYTRNPMYVGFLLILLAAAAFLSNLAAFAFVPAFVVYMNVYQIEPEERVLTSLFPNDYPAYRAKVRRWV